jgi:hypothetical protein
MNELKIYIKGTTGFRSALKAKLKDVPKYKVRNINIDNIMVLMTAGSQLTELKDFVGKAVTTLYGLQFLTSLDTQEALELSRGQLSEPSLKMTPWTSDHPNIRSRGLQRSQRRTGVTVF